jgi:hypothetical protein
MLRLALPLALLLVAASGCRPAASGPRVETAADSLALRITDGAGGLAAWDALPALAFEWTVIRDSAVASRASHVWDKRGNRYRVEWSAGQDSMVVAIFAPSGFDPDAPTGLAALNGEPLDGEALADRLGDAYGRFINDSYWLLAPLKVFDPGVSRGLAPDSGAAVLTLAFGPVGLTPGDRYWMHTDGERLTGWSYALESGTVARWTWTDPVTLDTPRGRLSLPTRKVKSDGTAVILTEPRAADPLDETLFTDLFPRLVPTP